ncbi:VWA domain-containing protein [soil metagenome]
MTPGLAALEFLRPAWLLGLLALPLLAWWWRARQRRHSAWRDAVDPHLLPHLLEGGSGVRGNGGPLLAVLAGALALLALAGPSWRSVEQPLQQGEAPLVVALDLSSATLAPDLPPSRLRHARAKIDALLRARGGGQVGLVAFADDAFTVAPLTSDTANIAIFLDALAPDIMPFDGSRPARAIDWSAMLLQRAGFDSGDILLLTDAADANARAAAARAVADGYRVSVLGMGSATGAAYRAADGSIAHARLDAGALRALAAAGGGRYSDWQDGTADLAAIGALDAQTNGGAVARGGSTQVPQDGGYWLLPALMLLALLAFRRGSAFAVVLLCLWLPWQPLHAQALGTRDGGWWQRADQGAHARSQRAEAAYRKGEFAAAAQAWKSLPGADAAYNRGNALAKAGRYEDALAAYDEALRLRPGMEDAVANKAAVEAAMQRKPPPSPRDNSRGDRQQRPDQGQPQPNAGDPGGEGESAEGGQDGQPRAQPPEDATADSAQEGEQDTPQPAEEARQRDADAAQRARIQRALENRTPDADGTPVEGAPERAESPADRERRQANEAWLKRVPDDPGGLLRARFRLEHERRQQSGASSP